MLLCLFGIKSRSLITDEGRGQFGRMNQRIVMSKKRLIGLALTGTGTIVAISLVNWYRGMSPLVAVGIGLFSAVVLNGLLIGMARFTSVQGESRRMLRIRRIGTFLTAVGPLLVALSVWSDPGHVDWSGVLLGSAFFLSGLGIMGTPARYFH